MGFCFDSLSEEEVVRHIVGELSAGRGGWLVNPNTDVLRTAVREAECANLVRSADLVIADGQPLVWASRLQGTPLPQRVAGSDLIYTLSGEAWRTGVRVLLVGGNEGVAERAADVMRQRMPGLDIGWHFPPHGFEKDPASLEAVFAAVESADPAIVFCGLGFPKQERLMRLLSNRFQASWFIGTGASLGFVAGESKRAPVWAQKVGLEWMHRLGQEPGRLAKRYLVHDMPFAARMLATASARRTSA